MSGVATYAIENMQQEQVAKLLAEKVEILEEINKKTTQIVFHQLLQGDYTQCRTDEAPTDPSSEPSSS
jgi:hypothetical protein